MKIENYFDLNGILNVSGLFFATGSFGTVDGDVKYLFEEKDGVKTYTYTDGKIELCATFTEYENGVVIRRDFFKNCGDTPVVINKLVSRFRLDGNAYEVYTQFNGWEHESLGGWQNLVTQVAVGSQGIRSCDGATPILGLYNVYNGKSTVFHLFPNCQWKMKVKKVPLWGRFETVVVETGITDEGLKMEVATGETIELPQVAFFQADSKTDLDAYKLHEVYNALYPRKKMPVIYNSWLYCFDFLNIEELLKQVDCAAELGVEGFMIDAGWFGEGEDWSSLVGDWKENEVGGPKGRLIEIANRVREKGMIFGLWFEPERAGWNSKAIKELSKYYFKGRFFDFTSEEARQYMLDTISAQIEKYGIGWVKFDFNDTIPYDETGSGFYRYLQGQKEFVCKLKEKYPDLYITNCASGGYRMDLYQGTFTDSFWLSDNQGPYEGMRIVKDTIKRLPSALIERWNVQKYVEGFLEYGNKEKVGRILHCNNGTWDYISNVKDGYSKTFMTGGPIGFSCDLDAFPERYKNFWKDAIAEFKQDREFYLKASARILTDTENLVVIEYADSQFEQCILQIFTKNSYATDLTVYPVVDKTAVYEKDGEQVTGKDICENGLRLSGFTENNCVCVRLKKV